MRIRGPAPTSVAVFAVVAAFLLGSVGPGLGATTTSPAQPNLSDNVASESGAVGQALRAPDRVIRRLEDLLPHSPAAGAGGLVQAGFENGFAGWNMDGVGDVGPTISDDVVETGSSAAAVVLTGTQGRSELILDGSGSRLGPGTIEFHEGDERYYAFSFLIRQMVYGHPGAHNAIMQFHSDGDGGPNFALQLWDYAGDKGVGRGRGLWSYGPAMGGDRFLAPIQENVWNDVVVHFKASRIGAGFYEVYLNGRLIDSRDNISMIRSDRTIGYIKTGLYRNGETIPGTSDLRFDSVALGTTMAQVVVP